MITSELKDGIVWLTITGELEAKQTQREIGQRLTQKDTFSGFITDLRGLNAIPSMEEQKRLEAWREQNESGKPHAILGRTNALSALVTIYVRLTKARDTRYFINAEAAVDWVKNFR